MVVYLLNSPVLSNFGVFKYRKLSVEEAKELIKDGFVTAIGHEATAQLLTYLLGVEVKVNRVAITMREGDRAIVVRIKGRLPEGKVLGLDELKASYELGLLEMLEEGGE